MFNLFNNEQELGKVCSMLSGREHGVASFIVKASEELEECYNSSIRFDGCKFIKVSAEELMMIADFRRGKIEKAKQELKEVRMIKEQIIASLQKQNKMRKINE